MFRRSSFALSLAIAVISCGGPANPGGPTDDSPSGTNGRFGVTIDGVAFSPTSVAALRIAAHGTSAETLIITAANTTTTFAVIAVARAGVQRIAPGNTLSANMAIAGNGSNVSYVAFGPVGSGTFTVTSLRDSSVEGSIDLVLADAAGRTSKVVRGVYRLDF
jgi:hypothetical protein